MPNLHRLLSVQGIFLPEQYLPGRYPLHLTEGRVLSTNPDRTFVSSPSFPNPGCHVSVDFKISLCRFKCQQSTAYFPVLYRNSNSRFVLLNTINFLLKTLSCAPAPVMLTTYTTESNLSLTTVIYIMFILTLNIAGMEANSGVRLGFAEQVFVTSIVAGVYTRTRHTRLAIGAFFIAQTS